MDAQTTEFIKLTDKAISIAEKVHADVRNRRNSYLASQALRTLENLKTLKQNAASGSLPRPSQGIGFGLGRAVGEWTEDMSLIDAVRNVDKYYREQM